MLIIVVEKSMLTREINRIELILKRMKANDKIGNLEIILRGLRGRYQDLEKLQQDEKKKDPANKS